MSIQNPPTRSFRSRMAATLADQQFGTDNQQFGAPAPAPPPGPNIDRASLDAALAANGLPVQGLVAKRFDLLKTLGSGASAVVYSLFDHDLDRRVAVKQMERSTGQSPIAVERMIAEARITASLEHPNILPVHEIGLNDLGQVYFLMKQVDGTSLETLIKQSYTGHRAAPIAASHAVVTLMIAIGNAIAYAHSRGIVHQDIKPANIMLGQYGEVLLVDWGSARPLADQEMRIYGTPLYMSPEQARKERSDILSDIYCFGATLYHALTLRLPTYSDETEEFWRKKRLGIIDPLKPADAKGIPPALLAITRKAMAADPAARYQSMVDLVADLSNHLEGLKVSAYRESWFESLARWHHRNARRIWTVVGVVLIVAVLSAMLVVDWLQQLAVWGKPIDIQDLGAATLPDSWRVIYGGFSVEDGQLVTTTGAQSEMVYRYRLPGDSALEFDAEILPGASPCDLSVVFARDVDRNPAGNIIGVKERYELKFGAFDGSSSMIIGPKDEVLDFSHIRPQVGRKYHVRGEVLGDTLQLIVDGAVVCRYRSPFPFAGGYLGLFSYYKGKAFSHLKLYSHGLPQKIPVTAIGDSYVENGLFELAAAQYEKIERGRPGLDVIRACRFRRGLCLDRLGRFDEASTVWEPLAETPYASQVDLLRLDHQFAQGDHDRVLKSISEYAATFTGNDRSALDMRWAGYEHDLLKVRQCPVDLVQRYFDVRERCLADDHATDYEAACVLIRLGHADQELARFPGIENVSCEALAALGRDDEILAKYPGQRTACAVALFSTGRSAEIERSYPDISFTIIRGLIARSHPEEVLTRYPEEKWAMAEALASMGRWSDAESYGLVGSGYIAAMLFNGRAGELLALPDYPEPVTPLMALGHLQEADKAAQNDLQREMWTRHGLGLEAFIRGDRAGAWKLFEVPTSDAYASLCYVFAHYVMVPYLHELAGEPGAVKKSCDDIIAHHRYVYEQSPWFAANYLNGTCTDDEFLKQPHNRFAAAELQLCKAVKAELAGDAAGALTAYQAYTAMPEFKRGPVVDPVLKRFVAWRMTALAPATR